MLHQNGWLEIARKRIDGLNAGITEFEGAVEVTKRNTIQLAATTESVGVVLERIGSTSGPYFAIINAIREATRRALLLSHDLEIAVKDTFARSEAGLSLKELIPTQTIGTDAKIEQNGEASVAYKNATQCHVIATDELGIDVPVKLTLGDSEFEFTLNQVISIFQSQFSTQKFEFNLSRSPHVCEPELLPEGIKNQLIARANKALASQLPMVLPLLDPNIGMGAPRFYGTMVGTTFRFFAKLGGRRRQEFQLIRALPDWSHLGIKVAGQSFVQMIDKIVIEQGGRRVDGPHFAGNNSFRFTAYMEMKKEKTIGCHTFSVKVMVWADFRCWVETRGPRTIVFSVEKTGHRVEVDSKIFPGVDQLVELLTKRIVDSFIPVMNFQKRFYIDNSERVDVDLNSSAFTIFVRMAT